MYGQIFEGWAPHLGDSIDLLHVPLAAASAEIFVTEDARLRTALQRGPRDEVRIVGLSEFLAECGSDSDAT